MGTCQINVRKYQRGNQKLTFQRNLQHRVPQDKNTTQYVLDSMVYYDKSKLQFIETVISALYQIFYSVLAH